MQLLRQPDAQPYEIVRLPENPLRHLTHCLSFLFLYDQNFVRQYAVTPLNGNAGSKSRIFWHRQLAAVLPKSHS